MPSSQTRTKLRAFQLDETLPLDSEKENRPEPAAKTLATPKTSKVVLDIDEAFETPRLPQSRSLPLPSTPGARLPLSDLVGNIDDTSRHAALAVLSPEEQLYWRGSQPTNTPVPRNNRKRARSSSPAGPSQDETRLGARKAGLTTPQADPAVELWTRYTNIKTPTVSRKSVAFAHLINESSPRSAAAAGSVSGLRRWASCGVEFPASTKKRRKTHGIFQETDEDDTEHVFAAAPSSDSVMQGQAPATNLASIVQRMKQSISHSQEQPPSSSSPLPETGQLSTVLPASPLERPEQHSPSFLINHKAADILQVDEHTLEDEFDTEDHESPGVPTELPPAEVERQPSASSDDFGEVDFDTDMADVVNDATLATQVSAHSQDHPTALDGPVHPRATASLTADSEDEFGIEDDDDVFAADLEQAASLFDTRPLELLTQCETPIVVAPSAGFVPCIDLVNDDSDGEFGDDIDSDEFAAAEVAATQTHPANAVCRPCATPIQ